MVTRDELEGDEKPERGAEGSFLRMAVFDAIGTGQPAWWLQPPALARVRRSMGTRQVSEVRRKIESGAFWCMASGETIENTRIFRVWEHATSKNRKSDALWCILVHGGRRTFDGIPLVAWALLTDLAVVESSAKEHER